MIEGVEITLSDMLSAREAREAARLAALQNRNGPLIALTLNIPGPIKRFPLADSAFDVALGLISGEQIVHRRDATGYFALIGSIGDARNLKLEMCQIERRHPLGQLFDIDVYGADGRRYSCGSVEFSPRRCLICSGDAHICARSRTHPLGELQARVYGILKAHFDAEFADRVGRAAARALMYELAATPKPGLVDRNNSGAHGDMDYYSFIDSIAAISSHFKSFALAGMAAASYGELYAELKYRGRAAEADMLLATGGVNTHKGALFTLGLIAGACGRLYGLGEQLAPETVLQQAAKLAEFSLTELGGASTSSPTHGELAYISHGTGGARQEAAGGFPSVLNVALPAIKRAVAGGLTPDEASARALLDLISVVDDTNLIARAGWAESRKIKLDTARRVAECAPDRITILASELDLEFTSLNLSPGGCADLLAAAWMLCFLDETL